MKFANGSVYVGDFQNNRTHGEGSLKFNDEYYVGDFLNGSMQGDGLWKNKDGDKYIGQWKNNKAHGYGVYITHSSHYQGTSQIIKATFQNSSSKERALRISKMEKFTKASMKMGCLTATENIIGKMDLPIREIL